MSQKSQTSYAFLFLAGIVIVGVGVKFLPSAIPSKNGGSDSSFNIHLFKNNNLNFNENSSNYCNIKNKLYDIYEPLEFSSILRYKNECIQNLNEITSQNSKQVELELLKKLHKLLDIEESEYSLQYANTLANWIGTSNLLFCSDSEINNALSIAIHQASNNLFYKSFMQKDSFFEDLFTIDATENEVNNILNSLNPEYKHLSLENQLIKYKNSILIQLNQAEIILKKIAENKELNTQEKLCALGAYEIENLKNTNQIIEAILDKLNFLSFLSHSYERDNSLSKNQALSKLSWISTHLVSNDALEAFNSMFKSKKMKTSAQLQDLIKKIHKILLIINYNIIVLEPLKYELINNWIKIQHGLKKINKKDLKIKCICQSISKTASFDFISKLTSKNPIISFEDIVCDLGYDMITSLLDSKFLTFECYENNEYISDAIKNFIATLNKMQNLLNEDLDKLKEVIKLGNDRFDKCLNITHTYNVNSELEMIAVDPNNQVFNSEFTKNINNYIDEYIKHQDQNDLISLNSQESYSEVKFSKKQLKEIDLIENAKHFG